MMTQYNTARLQHSLRNWLVLCALTLGMLALFACPTPEPEEKAEKTLIAASHDEPALGEAVKYSVPSWDTTEIEWEVYINDDDITRSDNVIMHDDGTLTLSIIMQGAWYTQDTDDYAFTLKAAYQDAQTERIIEFPNEVIMPRLADMDNPADTDLHWSETGVFTPAVPAGKTLDDAGWEFVVLRDGVDHTANITDADTSDDTFTIVFNNNDDIDNNVEQGVIGHGTVYTFIAKGTAQDKSDLTQGLLYTLDNIGIKFTFTNVKSEVPSFDIGIEFRGVDNCFDEVNARYITECAAGIFGDRQGNILVIRMHQSDNRIFAFLGVVTTEFITRTNSQDADDISMTAKDRGSFYGDADIQDGDYIPLLFSVGVGVDSFIPAEYSLKNIMLKNKGVDAIQEGDSFVVYTYVSDDATISSSKLFEGFDGGSLTAKVQKGGVVSDISVQ